MSDIAPALPPEAEGTDLRTSTVATASQSYLRLVWRRLRRSVPGMLGLILVTMLLLIAVFADFVSPVDPKARNVGFAPPDKISWYVPAVEGSAVEPGWRLLPVAFPIVEGEEFDPVTYQPITGPDFANPRAITLFAPGWEYSFLGIPMHRHLIGTADGKAACTVAVNGSAQAKFNAADLAKTGVLAMGGQGAGGRPDFAQGGAPDASKAAEGLAAVKSILAG